MSSDSPAIAVTGLQKRYGARTVVDGLSFAVPRGAMCALLGPNGAGKTTTVECIEGFRRPDAGTVRVLGLDPVADRDRLLPRLGVMLQEGGAYPASTPAEMLRLYARFYAAPADTGALLAQVGLAQAARQRIRTLSGGQRQRLNLALALVGRPEVVVLDEPTAGMDPQVRQVTWGMLRDLRSAGTTVLFTTHFLDEAERLADLVAVLDAGRLLALDSPAALVAAESPRQVLVTTPAPLDTAALAGAIGAEVAGDGHGRYVVAAGAEAIPAISAWFDQQRLPLTGVTASAGLEAVFLRLTGSETRP